MHSRNILKAGTRLLPFGKNSVAVAKLKALIHKASFGLFPAEKSNL